MASGYEINAKPVPPVFITSWTSTFSLSAKCPKIPNIVVPDSSDVNVSNKFAMRESLKWSNLDYHRTKELN